MEILLVAVLAAVIYFVIKNNKSSKTSTTSNANSATISEKRNYDQDRPTVEANEQLTDKLKNNRFYNQYKSIFDLIYYNGQQPQYKIDWLLYSLNQGRELESGGYYVIESMKNNFPYFCETEREYDCFVSRDKPILRNYVNGMMDICFLYHEANSDYSHPNKRKYWQDLIRNLASEDNLEAQAALCSNWAATVFSKEENDLFKREYLERLRSLSDCGNAQAQLAVGEFLLPLPSQERIMLLTKAANQGLTDACYHLIRAYEAYKIIDESGNVRSTPLPSNERETIDGLIVSLYYNAAKYNNGVMAAYCQWRVAEYFIDGDSFLGKDLNNARYWYKMGFDNGDKRCGDKLKDIEKLCS